MAQEATLQKYLVALLNGDRKGCRMIVEEALQTGIPANRVYMDIIWPVMVEIDGLFRADRITAVQEHMATRINRTLVDQLQNKLPRRTARDKKIIICSAPNETGELGGQMAADLFESDGWEVRFLGGGVTNDDILSFVNEYSPDVLMIYGSTSHCAPGIRHLIDTVKSVNAWPNMKIMVSGGLFNRAEGLWQEIGADLYAQTAAEAVEIASSCDSEPVEPTQTKPKRRNLKRAKVAVAV